jgi:4-amino-4-deoxychorismate lyase
LLAEELRHLATRQPEAVAKIIITRGEGKRGYAPPAETAPTRILTLNRAPDYPSHFYTQGIRLHICELRLAQQPRLAGIKHLNRLENVLATAEWSDPDIPEGLLLDRGENVIEGTRSNLFAVFGTELATPDLTQCGVAGVQRERVLEWAVQQGIPCHIRQMGLQELFKADELFLVNSIIGLWPVRELRGKTWHDAALSLRIQEWLEHAH